LALIVKRQQEIESFVPKQRWVLSTLYRDVKFTAIAHDEEAEAEDAAEVKAAAEQGKIIKSKFPIYKQIECLTEEEGRAILQSIEGVPFSVTDIQKKKGTEAPPRLYDLTSLQVDCNKKFGYSAEQTLQLIQGLYEKKFTTYPRVDTTFLSDDIYAKCPQTLRGLRGYEQFTQPLEGKPLAKSKKVFDSSKVTDHHAIIPTGVPAVSLTDMERRVYDLVVRAFIAVFYPDCKFETTTVFGEVKPVETDVVLFRTSGRAILEEGWKIIYKKNATEGTEEEEKVTDDNRSLPVFQKGENGSHIPSLIEKWTQPPKPYTEATLLRAMETAGKFVDNEELRDAMKENGIGRPSTRAAIIETLFKRRYIRKERKKLIATPTGVELIGIIREELLKSAELTGIWEKKLREIERRQYDAQVFISELKQMVADLINQVRSDNSNRHIAITTEEDLKKKTKKVAPANASNAPAGFQPSSRAGRSSKSGKSQSPKPKTMEEVKAEHNPDEVIGMPCPLCHEGHIVKGKAAYGCSRWKEGCTYRLPFDQA
jgi:DNA topoisomerase-3